MENRFIKIKKDGFNCWVRGTHGNYFLFLKNNTFSGQAGYTFRKFGKRKTCKNIFQIPKELEDSIKANNHIDSFKIIKKIISLNINEKIFNSLSLNDRKLIQTNLINFGYNSTIDGIWGKRTSSAVQKFVEIKKLQNENSAEVIFQNIISLNK